MFTTKKDTPPPLLEADEGLQALLKELGIIETSLTKKKKEIATATEKIQATCAHPKFDEERSKKDSFDGINALVSKTCTECGFKPVKPKGNAWEICENCWGPMKFEGTEPGQGCRYQHYECTKCKHHHVHT